MKTNHKPSKTALKRHCPPSDTYSTHTSTATSHHPSTHSSYPNTSYYQLSQYKKKQRRETKPKLKPRKDKRGHKSHAKRKGRDSRKESTNREACSREYEFDHKTCAWDKFMNGMEKRECKETFCYKRPSEVRKKQEKEQINIFADITNTVSKSNNKKSHKSHKRNHTTSGWCKRKTKEDINDHSSSKAAKKKKLASKPSSKQHHPYESTGREGFVPLDSLIIPLNQSYQNFDSKRRRKHSDSSYMRRSLQDASQRSSKRSKPINKKPIPKQDEDGFFDPYPRSDNPKYSFLGISSVGYMKDSAFHKRGGSEQVPSNTFVSNIAYLPGSVESADLVHRSSIKLSAAINNSNSIGGILQPQNSSSEQKNMVPSKKQFEKGKNTGGTEEVNERNGKRLHSCQARRKWGPQATKSNMDRIGRVQEKDDSFLNHKRQKRANYKSTERIFGSQLILQ
ncbi:unnamed protein product [Moneuplotes crassus]|uniref:Uncharacterized protein n=1 Tax=Euplotes crassus TaxID=5936 RepID=A0AAD1U6X1_EUPCR|nr:unnamed protein product [Moneuplotes crassus]